MNQDSNYIHFDTGKQTRFLQYPRHGNPVIPTKMTVELAEFVGIMLGDGNISNNRSQVTISCGKIEGTYITEYIPSLISKLFSKSVTFRSLSKEGLECKFSSREVYNFLVQKMRIVCPKIDCSMPEIFLEWTIS